LLTQEEKNSKNLDYILGTVSQKSKNFDLSSEVCPFLFPEMKYQIKWAPMTPFTFHSTTCGEV
jgi:hypothetical protein